MTCYRPVVRLKALWDTSRSNPSGRERPGDRSSACGSGAANDASVPFEAFLVSSYGAYAQAGLSCDGGVRGPADAVAVAGELNHGGEHGVGVRGGVRSCGHQQPLPR